MSAQLQAILPSSVAVGRRTTIVVLGVGTSFDGTTTVAAGANVTIHTTQVVTPSALRVELTADVAAMLGARDVVVTTGTQVLTLTGGLTLAPGATGTVTAGQSKYWRNLCRQMDFPGRNWLLLSRLNPRSSKVR